MNVPKLRFRDKSGHDYPQYQTETVGSLFKHISRRNTTMENSNVITNSAEFGLIPQRDFFDKDIAVEGNTDKYYIIERGDFVYNPRKSTTAPYGPFNCYQGDEEGIVSPLYTCLKLLHREFTEYLLWYFKSPAWYSYIYHNGAQGGARHDRVGMTTDLMNGIPVCLPCLDEQKKISEFLSVLEKRIEKQRQLVESLKSYKRGV
ncbi:MAG: restriction endonuclease subunit S, partial [Ruminococcus flavefaciens]|nr:restriction endonuclease subunit S [Ruminococcus flavefaciens]